MLQKKYNNSWKFWEERNAFALIWDVPDYAEDVCLPHDAMIENSANEHSKNAGNTGYRDGDIYTYVNSFFAPKEYESKTVMLKFEGVYMNAFVYVNGQLAGKRPYGYSHFYVSLDKFLNYGETNEIRVQVRNGAMKNSRWYSGGGIYRDVYLLVSDLLYTVPDGVFVKTESADSQLAVVNIDTEIKNRNYTTKEFVLENILLDETGNEVARETKPVAIFENEEKTISSRIAIENPKLWSENEPNLYKCVTNIYLNGTVVDETVTSFGVRTLQVSSKRGLLVNGEMVKLRGACIHHDSGLIGAATYDDAQYRQVKLLKQAGFNAIRMSHHPMSTNMLRACDSLGVFVMDESFDMWSRCKSDYDYGMNFSEWWEKDTEAMVRKDRNHPCVVLYSLGNEIPEIGTNYGSDICLKQAQKVKSIDDTRYTLASINGVFAAGDAVPTVLADVAKAVESRGEVLKGDVNNFMSLMDSYMDDIVQHEEVTKRLDKASATTDIVGYNYMTARYENDGIVYPNRVIVGSETYAPEIARNWGIIKKSNHVIGDFTWTGWDYIGEAGVGVPAYNFGEGGFGAQFPCQLAYCGDIDLTGYRRPASYYREIVFGIRTAPYIVVQNPYHYGEKVIKTPWVISDSIPCWNYPDCEGKPVVVEVYSQGDEVKLFLNDALIGTQPAGEKAGFIANFETTYTKGKLIAVSYENNVEIGRQELCSANDESKIVVEKDFVGEELIYLSIEICDENNVLAAHKNDALEIEVSGGATLLGFGTGNPKPKCNYNQNQTEAFYGRAQAVLKWIDKNEKVEVVVKSQNATANITI